MEAIRSARERCRALAAGELAADQWPGLQARIAPSYGFRRAANRRLPNSVSGLLEDALVLSAAAALAASARRSATRR